MADPDPNGPDLLLRVERAQVQSHTLREQVAELAEAAVQVELEVARVHEGIAEQGGRSLPRPGSMPTGPRSSRRGSMPRRSACAGLGGLRIVGLLDPAAQLESYAAWSAAGSPRPDRRIRQPARLEA